MKSTTTAVALYLAARPSRLIAPDCFTITLPNGNQYFFTNADVPVTVYRGVDIGSAVLGLGDLGSLVLAAAAGDTPTVFLANSIRISGLKYALKIGVDVDEQDITIACLTPPVYAAGSGTASGDLGAGDLGSMVLGAGNSSLTTFGPPAEMLEGLPFLQAMRQGVLDGAYLTLERAFLPAWGAPALGTVVLFHGRFSTLDKVGRTEAQVKVKTDLVLLDIDFPRNLYQPSCLHTLYDQGCTLAKSDPRWQYAGTVGAGATASAIPWSGATVANFQQGTILFTSGVLEGESATIRGSAAGVLTLIAPLSAVPAAGDAFLANWGCDHTMGPLGCQAFNNLANFRGFPFVPPASMAY